VEERNIDMLLAIILIVLIILLFGGLGIFVAKLFLIGLLLAALVAILGGVFSGRRT
jgi:hypothetical protein